MADNRPKLSTCPICGYTDTAEDADALQMAIEEHVRMAHNLDAATLGGGTSTDVKTVSEATAAEVSGSNDRNNVVIPAIALAPNGGGSGGSGIGAGSGAPIGAAALGAAALDDDDRGTDNNRQNQRDETSRF